MVEPFPPSARMSPTIARAKTYNTRERKKRWREYTSTASACDQYVSENPSVSVATAEGKKNRRTSSLPARRRGSACRAKPFAELTESTKRMKRKKKKSPPAQRTADM